MSEYSYLDALKRRTARVHSLSTGMTSKCEYQVTFDRMHVRSILLLAAWCESDLRPLTVILYIDTSMEYDVTTSLFAKNIIREDRHAATSSIFIGGIFIEVLRKHGV